MTTLDLDAIRARTEAATPGPWFAGWGTDEEYRSMIASTSSRGYLDAEDNQVVTAIGPKFGLIGQDAEFIAHARTDVPALLAEVARLNTIIGQVRELHKPYDRGEGIECTECSNPMTFARYPCPTILALGGVS